MTAIAVENVTGGSLDFESAEAITLDDISKLADAGKIIGIPANAVVSYVNFNWSMGNNRFTINWRMPPKESTPE